MRTVLVHEGPIAFFLTWVTYGTWLPGDARGWVEHQHGWKLPDPVRELEATARMAEDACRMTSEQRTAVERQILQTCQHRGWHLHAVNCRSNHVHVVVTAPNTPPKKIRADLKAWATRSLKHFDTERHNWRADRGSIRWILDDNSLEAAVVYTLDGQDQERFHR